MVEQGKAVHLDRFGVHPRDRFSWLWLAVAAVLSVFGGVRWIIPLAAWFASVFLLRFFRTQPPLPGFLLTWLVRSAAAAVVLKGVIPVPSPIVYYPTILLTTLIFTPPYLADRLITPRLQGFVATLVFPLAFTTHEFLNASGP